VGGFCKNIDPQGVATTFFCSQHLAAAIAAYRAARAINKDTGIVQRVLRLLDELAQADAAGILQDVRAAAGEGVSP